ncbi:amino acid ABC transporter permease [Falsirhodobacter halotolerans]|uniref:amino acid ABC transporter permease n=1 Tax=Falsirhodobacter halotolerans TaxID=1146892 RepID=UPI001FD0FB27|nr:amino acid ABC transporter permease [Falsirhodobacter halotolerans]MCJ8139144.1 amino acid ABC transporter permease [Falsirhodobacter halotolerans]
MASIDTEIRAPHVGLKIRWGQVMVGGAALAVIAAMIWVVAQSQSIYWSEIPAYMFDPRILRGVVLTLQLTAAAMVFGIALGAVMAAMAISHNVVLRAIAAGFVWWFRGVPLIVQIFLWFNIALFVPHIGPFDINTLITPTIAGFLALGLHEAANMTEIIRAGLKSVDRGQREAAQALGLKPLQTMWTIILPQAVRLVIPPTGNQAIGMLKASAIVSVIGMRDLLTQAQQIYAANYLIIEMLFVASIWYLGITTIASIGQHFIEKRFAPKGRTA